MRLQAPALFYRSWLFVGSTVAVLAFLILLVLWQRASLAATNELETVVAKLESVYEQEELLREATSRIFEIQGARRGFILTQDEQFLQSFEGATRQLRVGLGALRSTLNSRHAYSDAMILETSLVAELAVEYESQLRASIALAQARPQALAEQQAITLAGEATSRQIFKHLGALQQSLDRDFTRDLRVLLNRTHGIESGQAWLVAASLLALALGYALIWRAGLRQFAAAGLLADANMALEQTVQGRTAALAASELRYRQLVEFAADAIVLCDARRAIVYCNPAARKLTALTGLTHLDGLAIASLFKVEPDAAGSPDRADAHSLASWFDQLWRSPQRADFGDIFVAGSAGEKIPLKLGAVSYADDDGIQVQIVLHDMTRLHAGEIEMKNQLRFIDQLLEAVPIPLSVRDERSQYLRVNRAYELAYGCSRADIGSRSVFDVLPFELASRIARSDQNAMRRLDSFEYDNEVRGLGEASGHFLSRASAVRRMDGSVIGVIAVDSDVTEIRHKEAELRRINSELEGLSQQLLHSQESERRRVARDLHDQVGQILTALKISLETIASRAPEASAIAALLSRPLDLADEAIAHTRSLTASLHPHILEDLGLNAAVRWQVEKFVQPFFDNIKLSIDLMPPRGQPAHELVAFRVVQESLTNVIRHANASRLKVSLKTRGGSLHIAVSDDGDGFDAGVSRFDTARPTSLGIASMRERVAELGGEFAMERGASCGTVVRAVMPW